MDSWSHNEYVEGSSASPLQNKYQSEYEGYLGQGDGDSHSPINTSTSLTETTESVGRCQSLFTRNPPNYLQWLNHAHIGPPGTSTFEPSSSRFQSSPILQEALQLKTVWMPIKNTASLDHNIDPQLLFSMPSPPVEFNPPPPSPPGPNHATDYDSQVSAQQELCRTTTGPHLVQEGVVRHALSPYNLNATVHTLLDISTPPSAPASAHISASAIQAVSSAQSSSIHVSSTHSLPVTQASPSSSKMANDDSQLLNIPSFALGGPNLVDIACVYNGCDGSKTFKGRKAWRIHLRTYHKVPGGASARGACLYPGCDQVRAKGKGGLIRHIIADHSQVGLQCRQCNTKPFTREDPLLRHYKRVHRDQYFKDREDVVYSDEVEINW